MLSRKVSMEITIIIITVLSIFFCSLLPPCASLQLHSSALNGHVNEHQLSLLPPLPRKLRFTEQDIEYESRDFASDKKKKENLSALTGQQYHRKQNMVPGSRGTRQEWVDGDDPAQFFTMDYTRVRRRRPIHNKRLPVGP